MTDLSSNPLERVSALLYDAARDDSLWTRACDGLRQAFDCQAASLLIRRGDRFERIHGDCDQYYSDLYWNELARHDPLQAGPPHRERCSLYTDQSVLDKADFLRSVIYNEWFAPQDMRGVLLLKVFDRHGVDTIFTLNRGTGQSDFDGHDIAAMQAVEPVFRHAIRARRHLAAVRLDARSAVFDEMRIAHLIVNRQRRVLHMNTTANRLFSVESTPLFIKHERLEASDWRNANTLDGLVAMACADPGHARNPAGELVLLTERGPSLILSVHPLPDAERHGLGAQGNASVVIRAIGADEPDGMKVRLQNLFDLSAKEIELATMLLQGCSLREVAEKRNVRITTVRSQMASLFRKTGTARQGQLIALLARLS